MVMFGSMVENNKSDGERYSAFSCLFLPLPPDSIAQDCFFAYPPEGHQLLCTTYLRVMCGMLCIISQLLPVIYIREHCLFCDGVMDRKFIISF